MLITRLWKQQPGQYFCLSTKSAAKKWVDNFFKRTELHKVDDFIERNKDKDVYFCPHGFNEPRRKKECAVLPQLLWADLDEIDPRKCQWRPTIAIESSPGRYVGLWRIDRTCVETINQRMTYALGADRGGWDVTQVLRVPGTTNYKYHSTPRVRVMWSDGPSYALRDIERQLPPEPERNDDDAKEVYKKYEASFAPWIRRELLNGKPKVGKRSEMLWKLVNSLVEAGVSRDDCFTLLRASPWNKFEGNDAQLEREIEKATGSKLKKRKKSPSAEHLEDYRFLSRSLQEVEEENIDWIWYPYLARGELTILEGDPDVGKSYLAQMVSGHIVDGKRLPSEKRLPPTKGPVAYFDMENSAGSVTKKRITTNEFENLHLFYQEEEPFTIDDEETVDQMMDAIEHLRPVLVVFDTLNTYIGKADIYRSNESQQAFALFRDIARRYNCAVVVLRHLTKGSRDRALYRGQGSIAFTGLARVVITVGLMPDDPDTRVMAVTKLNITRKPRSLTYTITGIPDTLRERDRSKFEWGEFVDLTSDELVASPIAQKGDRDDAKVWLQEALANGPADVTDLERMAEGRSISWRTVQRAATELGVVRRQTGFGRRKSCEWRLDTKKERTREDAPERRRRRSASD